MHLSYAVTIAVNVADADATLCQSLVTKLCDQENIPPTVHGRKVGSTQHQHDCLSMNRQAVTTANSLLLIKPLLVCRKALLLLQQLLCQHHTVLLKRPPL